MILLADQLDLHLKPSAASGISMKMLKGASVCEAGGYSAEAVLTLPRSRDFSYVVDALRMVGEVKYSPDFEIAVVRNNKGTAKVFGGGQITVVSQTQRNVENLFESTVKAMVRAMMCTSCGICAKSCPSNAIKIVGGMRVDPRKCNLCGVCEKSCMVMHYYDRLIEGENDQNKASGTKPRRSNKNYK